MNTVLWDLTGLLLAGGMVWGIRLMSSPKTAVRGNLLGAICMLGAIILTLVRHGIITRGVLWLSMALGGAFGYVLATKVAMIQMPQLVAVFNGLGGGASALVGFVVLSAGYESIDSVTRLSGCLALLTGSITVSGSGIAAGKLHRWIRQRPIVLRSHTTFVLCTFVLAGMCVVPAMVTPAGTIVFLSVLAALMALCFGVLFTIRIGGADMPITISLLNSLSGVAASISGFAIRNSLLVVVGAIGGAAGFILTRSMCRAMNRTLVEVLTGKTTDAGAELGRLRNGGERTLAEGEAGAQGGERRTARGVSIARLLQQAKTVVIVPGYGMALAHAQYQVKDLLDTLEAHHKEVRFAIHPVAGRMPGHMNVLLAEVGVPYEKLCEMDAINPDFKTTDLVIVVGANDVVNPAAMTAAGTPIYGMPILRVHEAKHVIVCNKDTEAGYAGVDNPLYGYNNAALFLGDAKDTVAELVRSLDEAGPR